MNSDNPDRRSLLIFSTFAQVQLLPLEESMWQPEPAQGSRFTFNINLRLVFLHQNIIFNETIVPYLEGCGLAEDEKDLSNNTIPTFANTGPIIQPKGLPTKPPN